MVLVNRVHPVHLIPSATNPQTEPMDLCCESDCRLDCPFPPFCSLLLLRPKYGTYITVKKQLAEWSSIAASHIAVKQLDNYSLQRRRQSPVDADACTTYSVTMLRHATAATPDPLLCAIGHSSDVGGRTGTFPARLQKWCAGQTSGLLDVPTPVGPECGGSTYLPSANLRPYN